MNYKVLSDSMAGGFVKDDIVTAEDLDNAKVFKDRALREGFVEEVDAERSVAREQAESDRDALAVGTPVTSDHPNVGDNPDTAAAVPAPAAARGSKK